MRPVVSDRPGKGGRSWPLPVKEVVATTPFLYDRGSFPQNDLKPSLLAAQNRAGFDPATNFLLAASESELLQTTIDMQLQLPQNNMNDSNTGRNEQILPTG